MTELSKKINEEHNLQRLNHFTIAHPELKLNKKMNEMFGSEKNQKSMDTYISNCISRYKQAIYDSREISQEIVEDMPRGIE
ncbi:MAG: hypothetical protein V1769_01420, partial [Thermoplasmatota archaeon]